jgi:hypothetical protein
MDYPALVPLANQHPQSMDSYFDHGHTHNVERWTNLKANRIQLTPVLVIVEKNGLQERVDADVLGWGCRAVTLTLGF